LRRAFMQRVNLMRKTRSSNHGLCKTAEYAAWARMIQRCTNKNLPKYPSYGGRGIRVCDRWRFDFLAFLGDMGQRPSVAHSLDRIDVNGNYEPGNCRWATALEQQSNKTTSRYVEVGGERITSAEAARRRGAYPAKICRELQRAERQRHTLHAAATKAMEAAAG